MTFAEDVPQFLSHLPHLARLNLSETNVSDEALSFLAELQFLEYLNLYGTDVSDRGIRRLAVLGSLKKLYLWNTSVTAEGVADLQRSLPDCSINRGTALVSIESLSGPQNKAD